MNADTTGTPRTFAREEPQVGDIVLVAVWNGYIMKVLAVDPGPPERPYCCRTFPDASYIWESLFSRSELYQVLIKADGTVLADPASVPMRMHRLMLERRSCVLVYEREEDVPWRALAAERVLLAGPSSPAPGQNFDPARAPEETPGDQALAGRTFRTLWDIEAGGAT